VAIQRLSASLDLDSMFSLSQLCYSLDAPTTEHKDKSDWPLPRQNCLRQYAEPVSQKCSKIKESLSGHQCRPLKIAAGTKNQNPDSGLAGFRKWETPRNIFGSFNKSPGD
jgi:hypothetical protein